MDKQQISVKLTMDKLGLRFEVNNFQSRLILQKAIYIAQTAGVQFGYHYSWYLHGPYCSPLASDGFAIQAELSGGEDEATCWELDEGSNTILDKIKSLFSEKDQQKLAKKLELLASVHFLMDRQQVERDNVQELTETLRRFSKDFKQHEVEEALTELRNYALI